jgi:hypothetical protein
VNLFVRLAGALMAAALAACTAEAPAAPADATAMLRGALRGPATAAAATVPVLDVTVYSSPQDQVGRTVARQVIEHERIGAPAAVVVMSYGEADGRHRVRVGQDFAWMAPAAGLQFQTPASFWTHAKPYLNVWNGALHDSPGGPARPSPAAARIEPPAWLGETTIRAQDRSDLLATLPQGWAPMDAPVRVIDAAMLGDELWLRIELVDRDVCAAAAANPPVVYDRGWVRQRAPAPQSVVAHYLDGC